MDKKYMILIVENLIIWSIVFGIFSYLHYEKKQCVENGGTIVRTYGRNSGFTCLPKGSDK